MEIKNTHHSGMPRFKNNTRQMSEVPIPHPNRVEKCGTMKRAYHRVMKLKKKNPIDGKPHKRPYQSTQQRIGVAHVSQSPVTQIATIRYMKVKVKLLL